MKTRGINCKANFLRLVLIVLTLLSVTKPVSATTYDWIGGTSTVASNASNWYNETTELTNSGVPGSGDVAYIGVNSTYVTWIVYGVLGYYTNIGLTSATMPVVTSNATWGSLFFGYYGPQGTYTYGTNETLSLSVNTGVTLTVSGNITQNHNPSATGSTFNYITTTVSGAGTLICQGNFIVGDAVTQPASTVADVSRVSLQITQLTIDGNIVLNSNGNNGTTGVNGICYPWFSVEKGTTTLLKQITFATNNAPVANAFDTYNPPLTSYPGYGKFSADNTSGSINTLELKYKQPIALADKFYVYFTYGGNNGTILYDDPTVENQTIYTANEPSVTTTATYINTNTPPYYNVTFSGSSTKVVDKNSTLGTTTQGLTVGNNLTTSGGAVNLNTNNPTVTVGNNWTNSCSVTQGSGNITVTGSVTNNSGGTLSLGTGSLSIATNYTNNVGGVYSQSSGTTYFNGSGAQALVDNSTTGTTFKLVAFNGGGTSTMSAGTNNVNFAVASTGVLTMSNSSKLVAGSSSAAYLTLKSDTNGTATVANIPTGCSITGFVTAQRFVQGSATYSAVTHRWIARNYRLMSSPVDEGVDGSGNYPYSLNYLGASTIITDCTSTYSTTAGNPSLYLFNEHYTPNNTTFTSGNFIGVTNISNTTASGTITTTDATNGSAKVYAGDGFMLYFRGDKVTHITGSPSKTSYPYVAPESVTFSATGNLNQGAYSVVSWTGTAGLLYTTTNAGNAAIRGFNLVGNPYPSSIDWSTFSNSSSSAAIYGYKVNPTIYILNPTTSNYDTYNASTGLATGSASKIIPSGQGFFVQANNSSPTLTFNESAKTNSQVTGSNLLMGTPASQTAYNSYLRLKLVTDSANYDDMVIGFNASSTAKYDSNVDSKFFPGNGAPEAIAGISGDSVYTSVKWLPFPKSTPPQVIRLYVTVAASGVYTLERTDFKAIPAIYDIWLVDNYKKDSLDIKHNTTYAFDVDMADTDSMGSNRFNVVIRQDPSLAMHLLSFSAVKAPGGSQITWTTENEADYTNFTVQRSADGGSTFNVLGGFASNGQGTYAFLDSGPLPGPNVYRLMITDLNGVVTYSNTVTVIYGGENNSASNNIVVYPIPASSIINLSIDQQPGGGSENLLTAGGSALQNLSLTPSLVSGTVANAASFDIKIVDITGVVVKESTSSSSNWQTDVSRLSPGTYIIQVQDKTSNSVVGRGVFIKM